MMLNFPESSRISIHYYCLGGGGGHEKSSLASNALVLLSDSLLFQRKQLLSPLSKVVVEVAGDAAYEMSSHPITLKLKMSMERQ